MKSHSIVFAGGLALFASISSSSCYRGDRATELAGVLARADRELAATRPDAVEEKYAKMAEAAFPFVRGSLALHTHDYAKAPSVAERLPGESVLLVGDAHPENLGTFGDASGVIAEWNDFDASGRGSAGGDLLRAASAFAVFLRDVGVHDRRPAMEAFAEGYRRASPGGGGTVVAALLAEAAEKGGERDELDDVETTPAGPRIARSEKRIDPDPAFRDALLEALPAYAPTRHAGAAPLGGVRDVVRRVGKGVSSLPLQRYEVLLEGPAADGSEDRLLELKEAYDGREQDGEVIGSSATVAERIVANARALGRSPALDLDLGWLVVGETAFVVKGITGYKQGLETEDVREDLTDGALAAEDLAALGRYLGGTLALSHVRGGATTTALDEPFLVRTAIAWADRTAVDHALFAGWIAEDPLLAGAD